MFKSYLQKLTASLIAFLFIFLFIVPDSAKACEEEPQTLLSLYLQSDLIILADYGGGKIIKKEKDGEYGYWVDLEHNLSIVKILKGQTDLEKVSFTSFEYQAIPSVNDSSDEMPEEYHPYNQSYVDLAKIKSGDRYLYFLTKNEESTKFELTDYASAVRDINGKAEIYERNIADLNAISVSKENQIEMLAEWLVRSIEENETRDDGIRDLSESFYGMKYGEETEGVQNNTFDKNFSIYTSKVAQHLNESQKFRVSTVLYQMLQESWFAQKPQYANYGIAIILKTLDNSRVAVYSYNMLKTISKTDVERRNLVMGFLTDVVEDDDLRDIYYKYVDINSELNTNKTKTLGELKAENELKAGLLKQFDKRFELMLSRNFKPFPAKG